MKRITGFTKPTTCFSFNGLPWLKKEDDTSEGEESDADE